MSAYVSRRGVVYHGGAPAEACEEMERQRARCEFGAEMRAARERKGLGLREFARAIGLSHATVSRAEKGDGVLGVASITRVAVALDAHLGDRSRGHVLERIGAVRERMAAREVTVLRSRAEAAERGLAAARAYLAARDRATAATTAEGVSLDDRLAAMRAEDDAAEALRRVAGAT